MVFHVFFKNRWGRGQPDDIGAINLGDEKFDPDSDKKPRAGQILWIRGLTRLQTQVTIPISLSSLLFSLLSLSHSLIISSLNRNQYSLESSLTKTEKKKPNRPPPPDPAGSAGGITWVTSRSFSNVKRIFFPLFLIFFFFSLNFSSLQCARPLDVHTASTSNVRARLISCYVLPPLYRVILEFRIPILWFYFFIFYTTITTTTITASWYFCFDVTLVCIFIWVPHRYARFFSAFFPIAAWKKKKKPDDHKRALIKVPLIKKKRVLKR